MYKRSEIGVGISNVRLIPIKDRQLLITEPDLEAVATIASPAELPSYVAITVQDVLAERVSAEAMKHIKHYILIDNTWVLTALMKKVHVDCFELSFGGGERLWTKSFGMGEPT
jgi:hypothetical protein